MTKSEIIFSEAAALYQLATTSMGKWMWRNHTQWVADKAKTLADKYGADTDNFHYCRLINRVA
jgi:hypothetical protein